MRKLPEGVSPGPQLDGSVIKERVFKIGDVTRTTYTVVWPGEKPSNFSDEFLERTLPVPFGNDPAGTALEHRDPETRRESEK